MKIAIITEGYQGTGYGHLTRCLSIYQAFEEKNIIPLYIANCDDEGKKFIPNVNLLQLNWIENTDFLLNSIQNYDIAIIDSYLAPTELYKKIYNTVKKSVYLDDYIRLDYPPGIIINGTICAENLPYKKSKEHEYLLGINYIPLRKEFWDVEIPKRNGKIKNVLITFGAQDFRDLTPKILTYLLNQFPNYDYYVVGGKLRADEIKNENVHYYNLVNARQMLKLMLTVDIAITAAGQTTYELARVGLPAILIGVIENQKYNIKGWVEVDYIDRELWFDDSNLSENLISLFNESRIIKNLVDGQGARRIIEYVIN